MAPLRREWTERAGRQIASLVPDVIETQGRGKPLPARR